MKKISIYILALIMFADFSYAQVMEKPAASILKRVKKAVVYEEGQGVFVPSGWMGDVEAITVDTRCTTKPRKGKYCIKWTYDISKSTKLGWAGVYWQYPQNNWGKKNGRNLTGLKKLSFWVRGENGNEIINITAGGIKGENPDTFMREIKGMKLSTQWKQYTINLSGRDLSNVSGGFCWTVDSKKNKGIVTFYFDDVIYD